MAISVFRLVSIDGNAAIALREAELHARVRVNGCFRIWRPNWNKDVVALRERGNGVCIRSGRDGLNKGAGLSIDDPKGRPIY